MSFFYAHSYPVNNYFSLICVKLLKQNYKKIYLDNVLYTRVTTFYTLWPDWSLDHLLISLNTRCILKGWEGGGASYFALKQTPPL